MSEAEEGRAPPALIDDFLRWLEPRPRAYDEVMEAWRTSCPRLTVFEDAIEGGLVRRGRLTAGGACFELTQRGRDRLLQPL